MTLPIILLALIPAIWFAVWFSLRNDGSEKTYSYSDFLELRRENDRYKSLVNKVDGMAQIEYDVADNLFANVVRQEILKFRKELT